jgi:hypothetical protein
MVVSFQSVPPRKTCFAMAMADMAFGQPGEARWDDRFV